MPLNWNATKEESELIGKIVDRVHVLIPETSRIDRMMDIEACYCNGCSLKLEELLASKVGDFLHDVVGIAENLNRKTGDLDNCFLPRFSV